MPLPWKKPPGPPPPPIPLLPKLDDYQITCQLGPGGGEWVVSGYVSDYNREAHLRAIDAMIDGLERGGFKPVLTTRQKVVRRRASTD